MSLIKSIGGKNVNFDFNKEFLSIFSDKIKSSDIKFINQTLEDLHPSDVANLIENLSSETRAKLIVEAYFSDNTPCILSKRIGNGIIILSSIHPEHDSSNCKEFKTILPLLSET